MRGNRYSLPSIRLESLEQEERREHITSHHIISHHTMQHERTLRKPWTLSRLAFAAAMDAADAFDRSSSWTNTRCWATTSLILDAWAWTNKENHSSCHKIQNTQYRSGTHAHPRNYTIGPRNKRKAQGRRHREKQAAITTVDTYSSR